MVSPQSSMIGFPSRVCRGFIGIVCPYGFAASAWHLAHVGVGGTEPPQNSGTCTGPPQFPHVPIVCIRWFANQSVQINARDRAEICEGLQRSGPHPLPPERV
jgi:hypothetical protein